MKFTGLGGRLVRDCHAEVLARRGLLKYLYEELNRLLVIQIADKKTRIIDNKDNSDSNDDNLNHVDEGMKNQKIENDKSDDMRHNSSHCSVKSIIKEAPSSKSRTLDCTVTEFSPFTVNPATGLLKLKEDYILHLYSSSQPCGNATIKKWAKGQKAKRLK